MAFKPDEVVFLPVGLRWEDKVYREVHVSEMTGVDEENVSSKKLRNNGAKAMTVLLQRCIQAIPGLVDKKPKGPFDLVDKKYVNAMFAADRDFLFMNIRGLGADTSFSMQAQCPSCDIQLDLDIDMLELEVFDWPDEEETEFKVTLPKGFKDIHTQKMCNEVYWRLPTGKDQEYFAGLSREKVMTSMIGSCISRVEGMKTNPDSHMVRRMTTKDRMFLLNEVKDSTPGVDTRLNNTCDECGHEWEGVIDMSAFFSMDSAETQMTTSSGKSGRKLRRRA